MKPLSMIEISKIIKKELRMELEILKQIDSVFWRQGYPKLENQLRKKIKRITDRIAKGHLDPQEKYVLRHRLGVIENKTWEGKTLNKTLKEIGEDLDLTPERIRQIEAKAIEKLKH